MGLGSVLGNALSGMRVTQAGLDVVSQNVSNAGSIGYVARQTTNVERVENSSAGGARTAQVQRLLDRLVQRQLWSESSGAGYTGARAQTLQAVDQLYGAPDGASALDTLYNQFTNSLQQLKSEPSNFATRSMVLDAADQLASRLNSLSEGIQSLRGQAEAGIDSAVVKVNELLGRLTTVNNQLTDATGYRANPQLEDERDRIITELSEYVDIKANFDGNNRVSIITNSGLQLFDGAQAVEFRFDARAITAESQWNANPALRTVGTINIVDSTGGIIDVTSGNQFRSGKIAALVELRDGTLNQMQTQLDELAAQMSSALSDTPRAGVAAAVGPATGFDVDLAGLQAGNAITLDYTLTPSGQTRSYTFLRVNSAASLPLPAGAAGDTNNPVVGINFSGGMASVVTQIQTALGAGFTVANPAGTTLRILDDGAAATTNVNALTAKITNSTLTNTGANPPAELPFFVDGGRGNAVYTGSFEGNWQKVGFASRISVNPALEADRSRLVVFGTAPQTLAGDTTRPQMMYDRLTSTVMRFSPATGFAGNGVTYTGTIADFARRTVEAEGQMVENATNLDEGQQIAKAAIESRFSETAGVNVDREMASLIELQNAYAANARIISAVKEMMDLLFRA
ncbi:MAG: flagellar hook-associated protein FlgK [Bosea sp. (in: a-proteobacteria)]